MSAAVYSSGTVATPSHAEYGKAAAKSAGVWPFGLGFLLLSGAGATLLAHRRLRTPVRRLPNGTRIA